MTAKELLAVINGLEAGRIDSLDHGRYRFAYSSQWQRFRDAFPLSLSLPLTSTAHEHEAISAFVWGLLPDNEQILDRWAKQFQVSPRNPFALLANVGEDCAGAFQFVRPERKSLVRKSAKAEIAWVGEAEIAARIRELRQNVGAWRRPDDDGQFSLAGAQPKTAFLFMDGKWGIPSGRMPTTHILKPPSAEFDGHTENEYLCLALARELGLPAARSTIGRFETETAIVIERYDRAHTDALAAAAAAQATARASALAKLAKTDPILRLHQEDLCQALGLPPTAKYQDEGAPSPERIVELLRVHSSRADEDIATFVDALAFNWLIAGTDAHAKNYALLHGAGGRVRLAPLYDLASALPYDRLDPRKMKLAMKIGGEYRLDGIVARHWVRLCEAAKLDAPATLARLAAMARKLPGALVAVAKVARAEGVRHSIVATMVKRLSAHAARCAAILDDGA